MVAVKSRPSKNIADEKYIDSVMDEIITPKTDIYTLKNGRVTLEEDPPEDFVTREYVDKRNAVLQEKLEEKYIQERNERNREQIRQARRLTGRRVFESIVLLLLVVFVSALMILMMYPQTQLAEMSRDNSNAKDRIARLKNEILDAEEAANGISDMDNIRAQALALGMQDPNQNQIVSLPIPSNDSLKTVITYDAYGVSDEALENAVNNLTDYYRAHPDSGN